MIYKSLPNGRFDVPVHSTAVLLRKQAGEAEGSRAMLPQIGARRFGLAPADVRESLNAVADVARLRRMGDHFLDVATWQELLDTP